MSFVRDKLMRHSYVAMVIAIQLSWVYVSWFSVTPINSWNCDQRGSTIHAYIWSQVIKNISYKILHLYAYKSPPFPAVKQSFLSTQNGDPPSWISTPPPPPPHPHASLISPPCIMYHDLVRHTPINSWNGNQRGLIFMQTVHENKRANFLTSRELGFGTILNVDVGPLVLYAWHSDDFCP